MSEVTIKNVAIHQANDDWERATVEIFTGRFGTSERSVLCDEVCLLDEITIITKGEYDELKAKAARHEV